MKSIYSIALLCALSVVNQVQPMAAMRAGARNAMAASRVGLMATALRSTRAPIASLAQAAGQRSFSAKVAGTVESMQQAAKQAATRTKGFVARNFMPFVTATGLFSVAALAYRKEVKQVHAMYEASKLKGTLAQDAPVQAEQNVWDNVKQRKLDGKYDVNLSRTERTTIGVGGEIYALELVYLQGGHPYKTGNIEYLALAELHHEGGSTLYEYGFYTHSNYDSFSELEKAVQRTLCMIDENMQKQQNIYYHRYLFFPNGEVDIVFAQGLDCKDSKKLIKQMRKALEYCDKNWKTARQTKEATKAAIKALSEREGIDFLTKVEEGYLTRTWNWLLGR